MRKKSLILLLAAVLIISGCQSPSEPPVTEETAAVTEATVPVVGVSTGDPKEATCKASYTDEITDAVVAKVADAELTNAELQVWYWAEVAQYREENHDIAPDFQSPLESQSCEIDDSVDSWQQYFLREAIDAWHSARALMLQSQVIPMPVQETYKPNAVLHEKYLVDIPATKYLYGYNVYYQLNTLHEKYLNALPETLDALAAEKGYADAAQMAAEAFGTTEDALNAYADLYNQGYMYFTAMSYYLVTEEEAPAEENRTDSYVDIHHILLIPEETEEERVTVAEDGVVTCSEEAWAACEVKAQNLLKEWEKNKRRSEGTFAELAVKHSQDTGTALDGGAYYGLRQGQLTAVLDEWCFDPSRQPGDMTILRSKYGIHLLYFSKSTPIAHADAQRENQYGSLTAFIEEAKEAHPMEVDYSLVTLGEAEGTVAAGEILYPDIAHERYPEVPLYIQQDYEGVRYGARRLVKSGCGITTLAMVATYLADEELTPPELAGKFGHYSHLSGTDGNIFNYESSGMGFYLREKVYNFQEARAALEEGQVVVSVQYVGYWTKAGHYLVLLRVTEDDMVQVRDSNIYNYGKLEGHKTDLHPWSTIVHTGAGFWIFEDKITYIPACCRCGTDEAITASLLTQDYICEKCQPALLRRNAYLGNG